MKADSQDAQIDDWLVHDHDSNLTCTLMGGRVPS